MDTEQKTSYWWHRQTVAETFTRIVQGTNPWVAIGDFLDEWRRSDAKDRFALIQEPIAPASTPEMRKWAAFCAAMVEWLCWQDDVATPDWTDQDSYVLPDPWFIYEGRRLYAWQLVTTPTPFRMRNVYGGDRMLERA